MGISRRPGFSVFAKPPPLPSAEAIDRSKLTQFHDDYGELCARINPNRESEWRSRGLDDLPVLCAMPGIAQVGVNLEHARLHILLDCIHVRDDAGAWRTIGEIIATYYVNTKSLAFENVTNPYRRQDGVCAHPHIFNGSICFSARTRLLDLFLEARVSKAMALLIPALRMDRNIIDLNTAYVDADHWPFKEGA